MKLKPGLRGLLCHQARTVKQETDCGYSTATRA